MITNYTSIKRVINKVFTDLNLGDGDHRIPDMLQWASEAVEKIGAFPYFEMKVTGRDSTPALQLIDYQTKVPMGANKIIQIGYSTNSTGPFYPMRYATGSFDYNPLKPIDSTNSTEVFSDNDLVVLAMDVYNISYESALNKLNTEDDTKQLMTSLLRNKSGINQTNPRGGETKAEGYTYVINGGYIKTNQRDGYLMVSYQAIPLDTDGYPLIPDDESFKEAIYWYIVTKLYYPDWKEGRIRDAVYYDSKRSWNFYCKQAYGNALMPNADMMESIKNTWLRLIPDISAHDTFFTKQGDSEKYFNQDNPRYSSFYEKVFNK